MERCSHSPSEALYPMSASTAGSTSEAAFVGRGREGEELLSLSSLCENYISSDTSHAIL